MLGSYGVNLDTVFDDCAEHAALHRELNDAARNAFEHESMSYRYSLYGVDNDFDLIEAMYEEDRRSTGNLLNEPWFKELRMRCAMNPDYTEKCLASDAFRDLIDGIRKMLTDGRMG